MIRCTHCSEIGSLMSKSQSYEKRSVFSPFLPSSSLCHFPMSYELTAMSCFYSLPALLYMNGAAIPLSTFSLSLPLFWTITTTAEASLPSGQRSRFRNWDISARSSLLRIHGRHDCSPCTRILCLASLSPPGRCLRSEHIIPPLLSVAQDR